MFTKRSRYYRLKNIVTPDKHGFSWESKSLRLLPEVQGRFQHTVESGDRLDHLAYKYYRQSLQWWRICDANPEYMSPRDLLGHVPQQTVEITVQWQGYAAPWYALYDMLGNTLGVEKVTKGSAALSEPLITIDDDNFLFDIPSAQQNELDISTNLQAVTAALDLVLQGEGLGLGADIRISKPAEQLWQIDDAQNEAIYWFRYDDIADIVNVFDTVGEHEWVFVVKFNSGNILLPALIEQIELLGFTVAETVQRERIGKFISIPPRFVR